MIDSSVRSLAFAAFGPCLRMMPVMCRIATTKLLIVEVERKDHSSSTLCVWGHSGSDDHSLMELMAFISIEPAKKALFFSFPFSFLNSLPYLFWSLLYPSTPNSSPFPYLNLAENELSFSSCFTLSMLVSSHLWKNFLPYPVSSSCCSWPFVRYNLDFLVSMKTFLVAGFSVSGSSCTASGYCFCAAPFGFTAASSSICSDFLFLFFFSALSFGVSISSWMTGSCLVTSAESSPFWVFLSFLLFFFLGFSSTSSYTSCSSSSFASSTCSSSSPSSPSSSSCSVR